MHGSRRPLYLKVGVQRGHHLASPWSRFSVMRFTVVDGRITAIDVETSAERPRQIVVR
jgi:hypothetical protein